MRRRLLNGLTVLALLVGVAVAGLWVRSYWASDSIQWREPRRGWGCSLHSLHGSLTFCAAWAPEAPPSWLPKSNQRAGVFFSTYEARYTRSSHDNLGHMSGISSYQAFGGFGHVLSQQHEYRVHEWFIPHWSAVAVLALPPLWRIARRRLANRRIPGRCRRCGYDLRATPDRCPECGASASVSPSG